MVQEERSEGWDTRPLKILQLQEGSSEVEVLKENLEIISRSLHQSGATLVSIVAVMGTYRTGKSFFLDLLMRYLKHKVTLVKKAEAEKDEEDTIFSNSNVVLPEETGDPETTTVIQEPEQHKEDDWRLGDDQRSKRPPPSWILEGNAEKIAEGSSQEGFAWRPGKDKCTQGIWLWSSPFVFTDKEGRKVAVLLMDTQGAWDDTMTKAQSATIFGLTALLSSKLIYNIQNRVEEDKLENMDYITTYAQTACSMLPGKEAPFGHLELLVRDWANYEDGFTVDQCNQQMREHMDDHLNPAKVPEDAVARVERLHSTFRSIGCTGLPHPGLKVVKPTYGGEISTIDHDFMHLLDDFIARLVGSDFPTPSAPLGCEITVGSFERVVMNFAEVFRENSDMAIGMREAFVKVELMTSREDIMRRFKEKMNQLAPDHKVLDPVFLKAETDRIQLQLKEEFEAKLKPWRMKDSEEAESIGQLVRSMGEISKIRCLSNEKEVEGATVKLLASPVVGGGAYFLLVHHWILYIVAPIYGYTHMKKWSNRKQVELLDPQVLQGITEDMKKFGMQRYRDLQAIQIALNNFNPGDAIDQLKKVSKQAGGIMAGQVVAATSQGNASGGSSSSRGPSSSGAVQ